MRRKIYEITEPSFERSSKLNTSYNITIFICIIASMIPVAVKSTAVIFTVVDKITVTVFILDYILRFATADYRLQQGGRSFLFYPLKPMSIVDLLSILPSFVPINSGFKVLRLFRIVRTFKVFRSFKVFRYSKNISRIVKVLKKESHALGAVLSMAVFYVLFTALIMFNIEPDTFNNFFDALYWAVISLTSVGYGDIIPSSDIGRLFTMISAFVGVAVVALPSGIITAGYINILDEEKRE